MDVHSRETRSYNMSRIRGTNTKPELLVRKYLFSQGFRYRINDKKLPGKPDVVLPKYKTVIFINGCFWHGHDGCRYFVVPKTRTEWWLSKIKMTKLNDNINHMALKNAGWKVLVIWECELRPDRRDETLSRICNVLKNI